MTGTLILHRFPCGPALKAAALAGWARAFEHPVGSGEILMLRPLRPGDTPAAVAEELEALWAWAGREVAAKPAFGPAALSEAEVAYALGVAAARGEALPEANPYPPESRARRVWREGYRRGLAAMKHPASHVKRTPKSKPGRGRARSGDRREWTAEELGWLRYTRHLPAEVAAALLAESGPGRGVPAVKAQRCRQAAAAAQAKEG